MSHAQQEFGSLEIQQLGMCDGWMRLGCPCLSKQNSSEFGFVSISSAHPTPQGSPRASPQQTIEGNTFLQEVAVQLVAGCFDGLGMQESDDSNASSAPCIDAMELDAADAVPATGQSVLEEVPEPPYQADMAEQIARVVCQERYGGDVEGFFQHMEQTYKCQLP